MLMTKGQASPAKVCFVCAHALPLFDPSALGAFGGAEVQVAVLAKYLVRRGFEVDVIVLGQPDEEPRTLDGVRLIFALEDTSRAGAPRKLRSKGSLLRALRRSQADVYVGTCAGPEAAVIAVHARLAGKSFVYRAAHEMDCDGSYERRNGWRGLLFGWGKSSADLVVAQHDEQRRMLAGRGRPVEVIHNSFDLDETRPGGERDIDALWVARCEGWKRPELFIELAKSLPTRKFLMICPPKQGEEALFEKIHGMAAEAPNLTFIERVPFGEVQPFFDRSLLLVGTSEFEGFPNTYIQASIAGTPIASLTVDPGGFVEREGAGIVAHGELSTLKQGVEQLLGDPARWANCSGAARAYAIREHDIEVEGAKWADLLLTLRDRRMRARSVVDTTEEAQRA
jgi:glycosyltransferase involved in cell wall biosynthesis